MEQSSPSATRPVIRVSYKRLLQRLQASHLPPGGDRLFLVDASGLTLPKRSHKAYCGFDFSKISEALDRANAAWSALLDVIRIFVNCNRFGWHLQQSFERAHYAVYSAFLEDRGEALLKFHFNNLMCRALRTDELMVEEMPPLFQGPLLKLIKHQLLGARSGKARCISFFYSLLQSKRKWLKLSEAYETQAVQKHKNGVCGRSPMGLTLSQRSALVMAVDLVVPARYKQGRCLPTFSSCLEAGRKEGGNHSRESIGSCYLQPVHFGLRAAPDAISKEQFLTSAKRCLDPKVAHECKLQILPEPGKFRIITKGPSSLYTASRPLQRFLLAAWKETPFSTMSADWEGTFLTKIADSRKYMNDSDNAWVSGDYSAATDELSWSASKFTMDLILQKLEGLSDLERSVIEKSWSLSTIDYGDEKLQQQNGQLMGHPLSFPVLCIINLATVIETFVSARTRLLYMSGVGHSSLLRNARDKLLRHGVTVNGDDIAFWSSSRDYSAWSAHAAGYGLKKSVGKNYRSRTAVMINSRLAKISDAKFVGYANLALADGHRLKSEPKMTLRTVAAIDVKLRQDLPDHIGRYLRSRLLRTHREFLRTPLNWFLCKELGGLGLENLTGERVRFSDQQRRLAYFLDKNPLERILTESLDRLPAGTSRALRMVKRVLPPLAPRLEQGPLRYGESLDFVEEVFQHFLTVCSYLPGAPTAGDYTRRIRQVTGPRMHPKRMVAYVAPSWKLSACAEPHPGVQLAAYDLIVNFGQAVTDGMGES